METTYFSLGSKTSFNKALRHFYSVTDAVSEVEAKSNIADYINDLLDDEELHPDQILPIIGSVVKDKFNYSYSSFGIVNDITEFDKIADDASKWSALAPFSVTRARAVHSSSTIMTSLPRVA